MFQCLNAMYRSITDEFKKPEILFCESEAAQ